MIYLTSSKQSGQAIVILAFAMVLLLGFAGLAIDGGRILMERRRAQTAADNAAMAGALQQSKGGTYSTIAQTVATSNGYNNDGSNNTVTLSSGATPSGACPSSGTDITVTIQSNLPMTFSKVVGWYDFQQNVVSTARVCQTATTNTQPIYVGNSVFATKTGTCNGQNDSNIYMNGSGNVQFWGGGVGSASTDGGCLRFQGGQSQFKKQESGTDCADIVTAASSGGTFNNVTFPDSCGGKQYGQTFEAPPANLGITCSTAASVSGSSMTAGSYTGSFPPNGVTTLGAGTYCVNGDFRVNANQSLSGTGVTIVMNSGEVKWNGSSQVTLSAPTSGTYKGLVIYAPPTNSSPITIDGSGNAKVTGTVLAQNSDCYFAGSGQLQKQVMQFVCYTWGMAGNGQAEIVYDASKFFIPPVTNVPSISLLR